MTATENPESVKLENEQAAAGIDAGETPPVQAEKEHSCTDEVIPTELTEKLAQLSHKQSRELIGLRRSFERLGKPGTTCEEWQALQALLEKNHQYQQQLQQRLRSQLEALNEALEAGRSKEALSLWDRVQGNIQQCTGKLRVTMQKEAGVCKGPLLEMRKWRNYAATEKKKELIAEMGKLPEAGLPPPDLSRRIQTMHEQWKALGRSEQNEKLWREFKKLSDQAYAPCKEYYRERKQRMTRNLKIRTELCEKLEVRLTEIEGKPVHIVKLNQLVSECNASWKDHAPVEQSKIKPLQKRYYGALKKLTNLRKEAMAENTARKQACVERAKELAAQEDCSAAAAEARKLQTEWKRVGPAEFRDEKRFREEFGAACEAIFKAQGRKNAEQQARMRERARPPAERNHDELLERMAPRIDYLEKLEAGLFGAADSAAFVERRQAINIDDWEQLPAADENRAGELDARLQELLETESLSDLESRAADCEQQQRRDCVQLEIHAGVNSPQEDHALRMEMQLQQLASGFGKRGPDNRQLAANLREAEVALTCAGPMAPDARKALWQRLRKLRQRISSRPPRTRTG
ncbi:MAG: DUF349 domain-containing protein [Gammaproteobacteria bacterium]|nr:DUF349 domain-containing protein [Gammaproteobacteria bacterium]MYE30882.1 DUF349 domain-containing protein [Gammaproteobacteria bacterium]